MNYSQIGLILDIIGVLILFVFGLPSKFKDGTEQFKFPKNDYNDYREKYNKAIKFMAQLGLLFLIAGFILQFIGSYH